MPSAVAAPHKSAKHAKKSAKVLKQKLHGVRAKIHQKRAEIHETRRSEQQVRGELDTVVARLHRTEASIRHSRARIGELKVRQGVLQERIVATQHRLDARRRILAMRVRQNYERGSSSYVQVLLRSRDMHEYMSRSYYVQQIVQSDTNLIHGIKGDQQQLKDDKQQLDAEAREQAELKARLEDESAQHRADARRKYALLNELRAQEQEQIEQLEAMEQESASIEADIRASMETPAGRVRASHAWTGSFIRPADGPITSGFGSRYHPILHRVRMHTGIDIGAGYGASIHAAAGGVVIFSGSRRGYGNCVIIDHGGGVSTLYGHCSRLLVSEGQQVSQGQTIARVGATGLATGPHLHFEVRHNGVPVNPR